MARKKPAAPLALIESRPALALDTVHPLTSPVLPNAPARYSLALHNAIVDSITRGNRPPVAAAAAGLPLSSFHAWMAEGHSDGGNPVLVDFANDVVKAMADAESQAVAMLSPEGPMSIETAQWWLERARPEGWSKQSKLTVTNELNDFLDRLEKGLTPEEFEKVLSISAGAQSPRR